MHSDYVASATRRQLLVTLLPVLAFCLAPSLTQRGLTATSLWRQQIELPLHKTCVFRLSKPATKIWTKISQHCQRQRYSSLTLVSRNIIIIIIIIIKIISVCSEISCNVKSNVYLAMEIPDRVSFVSGQNSDEIVRSCELS